MELTNADTACSSLLLAGYASDVCVRMTAMDAYNRGIPTTILKDCVLPERGSPEEALEYLQRLTNCHVATSDEWLSAKPREKQ